MTTTPLIEMEVRTYRETGRLPARLTGRFLHALTRRELTALVVSYRGVALSGTFVGLSDIARFQTARLKRIERACRDRGVSLGLRSRRKDA